MPGSRRYPRVARVNEVLREVLAEAIERMADSDERLAMLTVTAVKTDPDLRQAKVLFDSLSDEALEALQDARPRLQGLIGNQVRMKWTPNLSFGADPAVQSGRRVEDILKQIRTSEDPPGRPVAERSPTARRVPGPVTDGLVVIDKPAGWTSHDVVARCRGIFGQKKVGHAGTLDPDATGVLLVGLGQVTRLLRFLTDWPKSYTGDIVFGVSTSTLDASGEVTGRWDMDQVTLADATQATAKLTGPIAQIPPMVSAIKIGGRRLHDLARQGIVVDRPARHVTVTRFDLTPAADSDPGLHGGGPVFTAEVECSAGTYIRSLAADLGTLLGGGAHLRNLRRTAIGPFTLADAAPLDVVGADRVIAPAAAIRGVAQVSVGADIATAIGFGKVLQRADLGAAGDGPWAVTGPGGDLLAVYEAHGGGSAKPAVVLRPQVTGDR